MNDDYIGLAERLIRNEHVEDGPELDKAECQKVLDILKEKLSDKVDLIVNINIELDGLIYDYLIDIKGDGKLYLEEWDNRYL